MVKLVDTADLKSAGASLAGSSPAPGTICTQKATNMKNKFNVDDYVQVNHPSLGSWEGLIYRVAPCDDTYEYWVQGAPYVFAEQPCLAWESEITLVPNPEKD